MGHAEQSVLAVLDVPYEADAAVRAAQAKGLIVVALDFDGTVAPDLVISLQATRRVPERARWLCGLEFAIVREEIRALGTQHRKADEVLVIPGGGDQGSLVSGIVERLSELTLCVVQGPAGSNLNIKSERVRVLMNPVNLPQLMAHSAWAVTTGGTTMLEMLCLGKAIHVVPRTESEWIFATHFAKSGALLGIGVDTICTPSSDQIDMCERRGPQLVDGRGCERIAIEIEALLRPTING
jgi:spore coat polysaccharide biosynthesis predicted glycosyltransferase SpsG